MASPAPAADPAEGPFDGPVDGLVFERWIAAFRGPLVGLCASWCPSWRDAEELAQDAFAEAWLGRARFRGDPHDAPTVGGWLRGIAFRLNAARARARARRPALAEAELGPLGLDGVSPDALAAGEDAAAGAAGAERRALLRAAFAELADAHQTVLRMHYLERTTTREVAALLGATPKAIEGRLFQARRALRERVARVARQRGAEARP